MLQSLVTAELVTFTVGVTGLTEIMAFHLTNTSERILLRRPCYDAFEGDLINYLPS
jgi:hypothetical protein